MLDVAEVDIVVILLLSVAELDVETLLIDPVEMDALLDFEVDEAVLAEDEAETPVLL